MYFASVSAPFAPGLLNRSACALTPFSLSSEMRIDGPDRRPGHPAVVKGFVLRYLARRLRDFRGPVKEFGRLTGSAMRLVSRRRRASSLAVSAWPLRTSC